MRYEGFIEGMGEYLVMQCWLGRVYLAGFAY